jgi:hypothetical protein
MGKIRLAVRDGPVAPTGAYFALTGSSTYFCPEDEGVDCYDVAAVRILNPEGDRVLMQELLSRTLELIAQGEPAIERSRVRLQAGLDAMAEAPAEPQAVPIVMYLEADETPMARAAAEMGYEGLQVRENDDVGGPSSVFIWAVDKVRMLSSAEREATLAELDLDSVPAYRP